LKKAAQEEFRFLSHSQIDRLKKAEIDERDRLLIDTLYETGCTVKELVNISKPDIDSSRCCVRIRGASARNREMRQSYVSRELVGRMQKQLAQNSSEYLFSTRQSSAMTTKRARQIVQSLLLQSGIAGAGPQIFRYTHIVHAYEKNIPISAIQKQVGLKRSRAIEIFSKLPVKDSRTAYEAFNS